MKINKFVLLFLGFIVIFAGTWSYLKAEGNEITACIKKDGSLYIPSVGSNCKGQDTILTWNIIGPQGPKGDKGDKGDPGESNWDENRIAALEARVEVLENPSPPEGCLAILCDNFNSYLDGPVIGQGGWFDRASGSFYVVQDNLTQEGIKALYSNNPSADSVITKTAEIPLDNGKQSFYVRTENRESWSNYNIGENVQIGVFQGSWDGPARATLAFNKDGHVQYNGPGGYVDFDTYLDNEWNLVEIEWRLIDRKARYRINNGIWTDWMSFTGSASFTGFDTVGFVTFQLGTGGVYIDNLH